MVTFEYISTVLLVPITVFCLFLYIHWHKENVQIWLYKTPPNSFFGFMIDKHTIVHFFGGFVIAWFWNIWAALAINFAWEVWDSVKPTKRIVVYTGSFFDKVWAVIYNNFFVSEGKFDVCDFTVMAVASLIALYLKTAFGF